MKTPLPYYYDKLYAHDWFYDRSDDHRVYMKGAEERRRLIDISNESNEHRELFEKFLEANTIDPDKGTLPFVLPDRPDE